MKKGGIRPTETERYMLTKDSIKTKEMNINYGELYGVLPGETDFSGAIARSLEGGKKNLSGEFLKMTSDIHEERRLRKL